MRSLLWRGSGWPATAPKVGENPDLEYLVCGPGAKRGQC